MNFFKNCLDFITGKDRTGKSQRGEQQGGSGSTYDGPKQKVQRYNHQPLLKEARGKAEAQGLTWFYDGLKKDNDGDVADEFLACDTDVNEDQ